MSSEEGGGRLGGEPTGRNKDLIDDVYHAVFGLDVALDDVGVVDEEVVVAVVANVDGLVFAELVGAVNGRFDFRHAADVGEGEVFAWGPVFGDEDVVVEKLLRLFGVGLDAGKPLGIELLEGGVGGGEEGIGEVAVAKGVHDGGAGDEVGEAGETAVAGECAPNAFDGTVFAGDEDSVEDVDVAVAGGNGDGVGDEGVANFVLVVATTELEFVAL